MANEKCLIEQTTRSRVHGSGPHRRELVPFFKIAQAPSGVIADLLTISETNLSNDLGTDKYSISKHCDFKEVFNVDTRYRQILLQQKLPNEQSEVNEYAYSVWDAAVTESTKEWISSVFDSVCRFRISVMAGNYELNWHIDADTSVICRAQICLQADDTVFEVKTKTGIHRLTMDVGGVYFINTGWSHRVVNTSANERRVAIFGFDFGNLKLPFRESLYV